MRDSNFILTPGWAINNLKLNPSQMYVFSYIFGYTQNGEQWYEGSYDHIENDLNKLLAKSTIIRVLDKLIKDGLIEKKTAKSGNKYRVNLDEISRLFGIVKMTTPADSGIVKMTTSVLSNRQSVYLSNILSNILGILPKGFYKNLTPTEKRFIEILTDEIWIDANLKRMLLNEKLYTDFDKEVLPVLANFINNKIGAGDVAGNPGRIKTAAVGYLRVVLKNKTVAKQKDADSEREYEIL